MNQPMTLSMDCQNGLPQGAVWRGMRILAVNAAVAVGITLLLVAVGSEWPLGANLAVALVYANCIGTLAQLLLPPLTRRFCQGPRALQWLVLLAGLLGLATAGSVLAGLILVPLRMVPPEHFWPLVVFCLRLALVITFGVGVCVFLYERLRVRLEATTLELRAKELERERAAKLAAEARLASLEARLHPHFLFNTLNAIAALIPKDPERAERLVERLAQLLRFSLSMTARPTVLLEEELRIVNDYLEIQAARLGERLRYGIDIPEELWRVPVPPLALHTLVENSVNHVAADRREGAQIHIKGHLLDGQLALEVWDDGPGFGLDEVPAGHGLDNLRGRLAALYGPDAGLGVTRGEAGTWVTLSIPRAPAGELGP